MIQQIFAFEGVDGVGKSTLMAQVADMLVKKGYQVETIKFPMKGTPIGDLCYGITDSSLTDNSNPYSRAMTFLLNQDEGIPLIRNALDEEKIVLMDRWSMSTMAYEGAHMLLDYQNDSDLTTYEEAIESILDMMQWVLDAKYDRLYHPIPFTFYCEAYGCVADVLDDPSSDSKYDSSIEFQRSVHQSYILALETMNDNGLGFEDGHGEEITMVDGVELDNNGNIYISDNQVIQRRNLHNVAQEVVDSIESKINQQND